MALDAPLEESVALLSLSRYVFFFFTCVPSSVGNRARHDLALRRKTAIFTKTAVGHLPQLSQKGGVGRKLRKLGVSAFRTLHEAQRLEEHRNGCLGNQRLSMGTSKTFAALAAACMSFQCCAT